MASHESARRARISETVDVCQAGDTWNLYLCGRLLIEGETFEVVTRIAECVKDPLAWPRSEAREVADSMLDHAEETGAL